MSPAPPRRSFFFGPSVWSRDKSLDTANIEASGMLSAQLLVADACLRRGLCIIRSLYLRERVGRSNSSAFPSFAFGLEHGVGHRERLRSFGRRPIP